MERSKFVQWSVAVILFFWTQFSLAGTESDACQCWKEDDSRFRQNFGCKCNRNCVYEGTCCPDYRDNDYTLLEKPRCGDLTSSGSENITCLTDTILTGMLTTVLHCEVYQPKLRRINISGNYFEVTVRDVANASLVPEVDYIRKIGCYARQKAVLIHFIIRQDKQFVASINFSNRSLDTCYPELSCYWTPVYFKDYRFKAIWGSSDDELPIIRHRQYDLSLAMDEFYIANDIEHSREVVTCLSSINSFASVARYLQLVAGSVSLTSLIIVVLLHWKFPKLQNVYGFCLLNLSGALSVTNLIPFLLEIRRLDGAPFTAVTHYAWLAVFCWETVIIFHVYRSISGSNAVNSTTKVCVLSIKNVSLHYALCAWIAPLPFVLTGVVCHLANVAGFQYGRHWFEDNFITTYIFFIPSFCLVITGVSLFIATMSNMAKVRSHAEETGGNTIDITSIALRLQLTLGIPWVGFIILKFFPDPHLLPVIATINSLQGFFIMLALVTTKRVKKFLKESYSTNVTYPTVA